MAFCTSCGKEIDPSAAFCTYCGARMEERVTADVALGAHEKATDGVGGNAGVVISQEPPVLQRFPVQDGNDSSAGYQGVSSDAMNSGSFPSGIGGGSAPTSSYQEVRPPATNDLLENWKYDPFLVALGFAPMVLLVIVNAFIQLVGSYSTITAVSTVSLILMFVHFAFSLVYVLVIHKSLFSEKPMINNVKLVSFLNAFAGSAAGYCGLIGYFGAAVIYERLNAELKNRKRAYAWIIMLAFCLFGVIQFFSDSI
ncbi:MAG: zinc ribbon domain-containing protein [Coriobacteriaceae bacterium]|nr:zinc ribbon domain-containing protein [Coriobacteriaceae bacterium]MDY4987494.1 zinc ribbon domain-containing protein [Eggerthellaceae bacterium]